MTVNDLFCLYSVGVIMLLDRQFFTELLLRCLIIVTNWQKCLAVIIVMIL